MALFADRLAADEVTRRGREILGQVADTLKDKGMLLLEADTDGVFFAVPQSKGWGEAEERALVAEVATTLPQGLKLEYEERYQAILSHEVKNYALLTYQGELISRVVAFRSSRLEPFGVKFLQKAVLCGLVGDIAGLQQVYRETVEVLLNHQIDPAEVATIARLAKAPEEYLKSRQRLREASYEAVLASGQSQWRVGERIRFYRAADGTSVLLPEQNEDGETGSSQIAEMLEREEGKEAEVDFLGEAEEGEAAQILGRARQAAALSGSNPTSSKAKPDKAGNLPSSRGNFSQRSQPPHLPAYDAEHYLRVLNVSYVSRLRKAFSPQDFEQLFRVGGQLGLFDRPLDQIQPLWIVS